MDALVMIGEQMHWEHTHPGDVFWNKFSHLWWRIGFARKWC